jgi:hypothetical protein
MAHKAKVLGGERRERERERERERVGEGLLGAIAIPGAQRTDYNSRA